MGIWCEDRTITSDAENEPMLPITILISDDILVVYTTADILPMTQNLQVKNDIHGNTFLYKIKDDKSEIPRG